ncbi:MAG: hypothetical protein KJ990_14240 [Proteobacteria bacterium]|nr:hypothetical protein [Pseudomonadota bacterium]
MTLTRSLLIALPLLLVSNAAVAKCPACPEPEPCPTCPEPPKLNTSPDKAAGEAAGVADLAMVVGLIDWARDNKSAEALATAAELLADLGAVDTAREKQVEAGEGEAAEKTGPELVLDAAALLAEAVALATEMKQKNLVKHLGAVVLGNRGAVGGPKYTVERVKAYDTDYYVLPFEGSSVAMVAISGDGDTDLDLRVYDENGNLIASDLGSTDDASVTFTPAWTGNFRIEVKNLGGVYNQYTVITN